MSTTIAQKVKTIRATVKSLLELPKKLYKDNDEHLVSRYWFDEVLAAGKNPKTMTAEEFLTMYAEGKLTPADIITRARRKVQEMYPELQGTARNERKGRAEDTRLNINGPE